MVYIYKAVGVRLIGRFVSASYIYNIIIIKHILYIDRLNKMGVEPWRDGIESGNGWGGHLVIVHAVSSSLMAHMTRASLLTF